MGFRRVHSEDVERALCAALVASDASVPAIHAAALRGELVGIAPDDVPPLATLKGWATRARRMAAAETKAATADGALDALALISGRIVAALERHAERLDAPRSKATPEDWAKLARATREAAALRDALAPRKRTPAPTDTGDPGTDDAPPVGFVAGLAAQD
jgi:hypothetical protein